jgi:integral membrane protein (TIGR01906 family)
MDSIRGSLAALVTGTVTALVVVALAILPFLSPAWVSFAQHRALAEQWTGFTTAQLADATDQVLADLVIGPPDFDATLDGVAVLKESERAHMRDVRGVFFGFFLVAAAAGVILIALYAASRGAVDRQRFWRRMQRAGVAIVLITIVLGAAGMLVFDAAFTLFHEVFFPGGNWQFDPRTDRLVQLFPEQFWVESTIGVGVVIIGLGVLLALLGRWRVRALASRAAVAASLAQRPAAAR